MSISGGDSTFGRARLYRSNRMAARASQGGKLSQVRRAMASLGLVDYLATAVLVAVYAVGTSLDDGPGTSIDFYRSAATVLMSLGITMLYLALAGPDRFKKRDAPDEKD